jgi:hypothetical protein
MIEMQTESRMEDVDILGKDRIEIEQNHSAEEITDMSKETGLASSGAKSTDQVNSKLEPESKTAINTTLSQMPVSRIGNTTECQQREEGELA